MIRPIKSVRSTAIISPVKEIFTWCISPPMIFLRALNSCSPLVSTLSMFSKRSIFIFKKTTELKYVNVTAGARNRSSKPFKISLIPACPRPRNSWVGKQFPRKTFCPQADLEQTQCKNHHRKSDCDISPERAENYNDVHQTLVDPFQDTRRHEAPRLTGSVDEQTAVLLSQDPSQFCSFSQKQNVSVSAADVPAANRSIRIRTMDSPGTNPKLAAAA